MRYAPGGRYEETAADVERARQYDNEFGAGRWMYSKAPDAAPPAKNTGVTNNASRPLGLDTLYGYGTTEAWQAAGSPKGGAKPSGGFDMSAYRPGQANPIPPQSQGTPYGQPVPQTKKVVPGQAYNPPSGGYAPVAAPKKPPFSMGPAQTPWGPSMDPLAERAKMIQLMEEENMRNQVQFNQTWTGNTPPPAEWLNARPTMTNIRDLIQQAGLGNGSPTMDPGYTGNTFVGDINQQFSGVPQQTGKPKIHTPMPELGPLESYPGYLGPDMNQQFSGYPGELRHLGDADGSWEREKQRTNPNDPGAVIYGDPNPTPQYEPAVVYPQPDYGQPSRRHRYPTPQNPYLVNDYGPQVSDENLAGASPWGGPPRPGMEYYNDSGWGWPNGAPTPQPNQMPPVTSPQPYQFPPPYVPNAPEPFLPRPNQTPQNEYAVLTWAPPDRGRPFHPQPNQTPRPSPGPQMTPEQKTKYDVENQRRLDAQRERQRAEKAAKEAEDRRNGVRQRTMPGSDPMNPTVVRVDRRGYPLDSPTGGMWVGNTWIPNGPPAKPPAPKKRKR